MRYFLTLFLLIFLGISCQTKKTNKIDVSNINVTVKANRFDQDFYESAIEDLPKLKEKYPNFFPTTTPDSIWIAKKRDKDELKLYAETQKVYKNIGKLESNLASLFQHIIYYDSTFQVPSITTINSNIDYNYRVIYQPQNLIISLDVYLGKNHEFYNDYPTYIKENNTQEAIVVDVAKKIINQFIPNNKERTFLSKMIYEGKKQYLLDLFLPTATEKLKSGYGLEKLTWAKNNEEQVWRYFIDKNLLYSTDSELDKRFLQIAPFSKFYLELDNKSPGQIGVWIGGQIVRSFMKKNDVSLQALLEIDAQELLKKSKYKPKN